MSGQIADRNIRSGLIMDNLYDLFRLPLMDWARAGLVPEFLQYGFVVNALACALVAGPLLGGLGTMVVAKRLAFFSQAVGQAALTGVALGCCWVNR